MLQSLPQTLAQEKEDAAKPGEFKTVKEKISYRIGMDLGGNISQSMKSQGLDLDDASLLKGIQDGLRGTKSRIPEADLQAALQIFQKEQLAKAKEQQAKAKKLREEAARKRVEADPELKAQAEKNAAEGAAFLKKNQAQKGVKVTPSGLQYQVLKQGTGKKPKESDVVTTHYHGTLPDGKVFDSSVDRKQPASFPVDGVIAGWTEALQMMPVGSKWRLVLPANLAYGISGSGEKIGPNQVLVFEVELLDIQGSDDEGNPATDSPK